MPLIADRLLFTRSEHKMVRWAIYLIRGSEPSTWASSAGPTNAAPRRRQAVEVFNVAPERQNRISVSKLDDHE